MANVKLTNIKDGITELRASNKNNKYLIDQLKFIGAVPSKESSRYTYFHFNGDIQDTRYWLGI